MNAKEARVITEEAIKKRLAEIICNPEYKNIINEINKCASRGDRQYSITSSYPLNTFIRAKLIQDDFQVQHARVGPFNNLTIISW